jgi:hypothetical protein
VGTGPAIPIVGEVIDTDGIALPGREEATRRNAIEVFVAAARQVRGFRSGTEAIFAVRRAEDDDGPGRLRSTSGPPEKDEGEVLGWYEEQTLFVNAMCWSRRRDEAGFGWRKER